jgi:hypothetical protein
MGTRASAYQVSPRDGSLRRLKKVAARATAERVNERVLESLVALNPSLIEASDSLPLLLHGGQDEPDQLFIDALGRLRIRAKINASSEVFCGIAVA